MPSIRKGSIPTSASDAPRGPHLALGRIPRSLKGSELSAGFAKDELRLEALQGVSKSERDFSAVKTSTTQVVQEQQDQEESTSVDETSEQVTQQSSEEEQRRERKLERVITGDDPEPTPTNYGGSEGTTEEDKLESVIFKEFSS